MILETLFSLRDDSIITISAGALATFGTFIYIINKMLNKRFDGKVDKETFQTEKESNAQKFSEMNKKINDKASRETVENMAKDVAFIRDTMIKFLEKRQ